MKNKKIKLLIGGTGHEITRSKFTTEEIEKIKTYCDENDEDIESVLTNDLEEVLENKGSWYDCDDLGHYMGANLNSKLYVTIDDEDEFEFTTDNCEIFIMSEDYPEMDDGEMVSFITWEKGTLGECEFEVDGEFDIRKLKLTVSQIETTDSIFEIIKELHYDGQLLETEGFSDTTGKAFDVEWDF